MFALVDCSNFFASCERVFRPDLRNAPVLVLSNNDGCVIARSNEAKRIGIKMGVPAYQVKEEIRKYGITVFSSNYILYGDMSERVMNILSGYAPEIEIYSIDEAFLNFSGMDYFDLKGYGSIITESVIQSTGIPVSMGVAPTKTLAKIANKFAKKYKGYNNVCVIDTEEKRIKALKKTEIRDVWGIGRKHAKRLDEQGVKTAYDFASLNQAWVKKEMTVTGEKMWLELQGKPCIDMEHFIPDKKQICTSRAFGEVQTELEGIKEAVATYAAMCAEKLRKQKSCASSLMVFIHTNNFRTNLPQYFKNCVVQLPVATSSTFEIVKYALEALEKIFKTGYKYKKAGVIITEIVPEKGVQGNLFYAVDREKHKKIMVVMDKLNSGFTRNKLALAIQGGKRSWKLKQELLSPCYTTKLSDIIEIR